MSKYIYTLWILITFPFLVAGQPYAAGHTRYNFAQTALGLDMQYTGSGQSAFVSTQGILTYFRTAPQLFPKIHIGGLHFWGHAEMYFSIPLPSLLPHTTDGVSYSYQFSDVFGLKVYPWALASHKLRPFIGCSISGFSYRQQTGQAHGNGPLFTRMVLPLSAGLCYVRGQHSLELMGSFYPGHTAAYYISPARSYAMQMPAYNITLGYRWILETTAGSAALPADTMHSGHGKTSFYLALGPSSAFFTRSSSYNSSVKPYLGNYLATVFMEYSAGCYLRWLDGHINFSYRQYNARLSAYGTVQTTRRRALTLEAHKYLFDYHGFDPYVGLSVSDDQFHLQQHEEGQPDIDIDKHTVAPGLVLGWDILPRRQEAFLLRTNLRYYPAINIPVAGKSIAADQLEFNFIQLLIYPQRIIQGF